MLIEHIQITDEIRDFRDMVDEQGWIGFNEPEMEDGVEEENCTMDDSLDDSVEGQYLDEALSVSSIDNLPINKDINLLEDPTIVQAVGKLNHLTANMSRTRLARLRTMHLLPIETMRKRKEKKRLASVKHNPHFSMSPAFRTESRQGIASRQQSSRNGQRSMSRSGSRGTSVLPFERNIDIDFYSLEGNEENSLFDAETKSPMYAPPDPKLSVLDVLIPKDTRLEEEDHLEAARAELKTILDNGTSRQGSRDTDYFSFCSHLHLHLSS